MLEENMNSKNTPVSEMTATDIPKTALVFEESADAEAESHSEASDAVSGKPYANEQEPSNSASCEPKLKEESAQKNNADTAGERRADDEEFVIPDVFDIAQASDGSVSTDDYVSTIWKPYVPHFTSVTENQYHFANKAEAPGAEFSSNDSDSSETQKNAAPATNIKVDRIDGRAGRADVDDPTAELESTVPDFVVVNISSNNRDKNDTINVFKFSDAQKKPEDAPLSPEESARREISGLTGHRWEEEDAVSGDTSSNAGALLGETKEKNTAAYAEVREPVSVSLPEDKPLNLDSRITPPRSAERTPSYADGNSSASANDTSEYNSFSMRDVFKDKFLDSLMAVKIRFVVAMLLGAGSLAFDIFKNAICAYFGFGANLIAPALIDACLIASLILITIPETVRGVKNLIHGRVVHELSVFLAGISLFAYSIAMVAIAPVGGYPLFGFVFAIMANNAIYATNCLHSVGFSAFKAVSEKGNKQIIDIKLTRTLELENIALDGAVDEHKSKTADLYTTPFVSGFFANSSKNSENTKNNLIILASGFGGALVVSLIMYFIFGIAAAAAAFALVISLSFPAFSLLSHKIPYRDVQKEAIRDGGVIIGEAALGDYAGVDVVCFEDTEVFGPDDVSLKSASDRRSDYHATMRKMASLFEALGGPLCAVFEAALNKKYDPARDVVIENDGVEGIVDGERVAAGNAEYMKRHGIRIPSAEDKKVGSTRTIYAAADGEFFATFTVHYSFSEEFAFMLSEMRERGMVPLVYTRDFNITNEFMRMLTGGADVIRVMREYTPKKEKPLYSKIRSPMVTVGDKGSAINLLICSKKYAHFSSTLAVIELTSCLVGTALAAAISLCGMLFAIPTVVLALWQICWSIALRIMSKKKFSHRKKDKNDAE